MEHDDKAAAVVTGASSGIGQAAAIRLAQDGFPVVVGYCENRSGAEQTAAAILENGGSAELLRLDLRKPASIEQFVADAFGTAPEVAVWANLAGADILTGALSEKGDLAKLDALIETDLRGTILCCWAVVEKMRAQGHGSIVNMSWDLALNGMAGRNPEMFAATKAGVTGFTRALARTVAPMIRVNEVAPGWIQTRFADEEMAQHYYRRVVEATPLARFGVPDDVAAAVSYLASSDSAFVTGQTLKINGGLSS